MGKLRDFLSVPGQPRYYEIVTLAYKRTVFSQKQDFVKWGDPDPFLDFEVFEYSAEIETFPTGFATNTISMDHDLTIRTYVRIMINDLKNPVMEWSLEKHEM